MKQFDLITSDASFDAVVLCNGDYPSNAVGLSILANARFLCCCDGAAAYQLTHHTRIPDAIVGDGDSLPDDFKETHRDILHLVEEQDDNDETKAVRFCMERGYKRIAILGATGKREDHTLGNISHLSDYAQWGLDVAMVTDYGWFVAVKGLAEFSSIPRQQVSIFNIDCTQLESRGLRWNSYPYKQLWQGTLNESTGDSFQLEGNGTYLVFRTFKAKVPKM